ncbi:MAG: cob(I)yrinic acid a,c-diamide adenosyltransferase [Vulcanibacillus sp.]
MMKSKGLTLVYTGDGKGKTSAAIGLAVRAVGNGMKVGFFQFIKSKESVSGEQGALTKLGIEIEQLGIGFTWVKSHEEQRQALKNAWAYIKEKVLSDQYDLIVLDELNNALAIRDFPIDDVLPLSEVIQLIKVKPDKLHLVITGRGAKQEIIDVADLVSKIDSVKHYYDVGITAVKGIDF